MHDQDSYRPRRDDRRDNNRRDDNRRDDRRGDQRDDRPRRGTPLSELDPALTEVSRKVIGCAIEVHMELGPGYDESVYLNALKIELDAQSVAYKIGHAFDVFFDEHVVGKTVADLWVADRFIVEIMARHGEIGSQERSALRAQLRAADVELGLIINFGERRLKDGLVRVLNPDKLNELKGEGGEGGDGGDGGHAEEFEEERA
ncbi:MAG: GxxExxY protein [Phycisphaerales bacterium]